MPPHHNQFALETATAITTMIIILTMQAHYLGLLSPTRCFGHQLTRHRSYHTIHHSCHRHDQLASDMLGTVTTAFTTTIAIIIMLARCSGLRSSTCCLWTSVNTPLQSTHNPPHMSPLRLARSIDYCRRRRRHDYAGSLLMFAVLNSSTCCSLTSTDKPSQIPRHAPQPTCSLS